MLQKFIQHLKDFPFIQKSEKQLLAVSGGVDSVVLCDLMFRAGYDFIIAHCNFQLRGEESSRDEQFVRELGKKYDKEVLVKHFETEKYASENKLSIQVAARELRYNWFREIRNEELQIKNYELGIRNKANEERETDQTRNENRETDLTRSEKREMNDIHILTAHHADDNIETVVMNFFRGTGLQGLTGMDNVFQKIFRPLLPFRKAELLAYANENTLAFVEDSSNANNYYTRNFFRNELLPSLKEIFPQVEKNILKNIERFSEAENIYNAAIDLQKSKLIEVKGNEEHIPILKLQKSQSYKTLLWEIIKEKSFTAAQTDEVLKLMEANNGSYIQSATHRIIKNRHRLIINPLQENEKNDHLVIDEQTKKLRFSKDELILSHHIPLDSSISSDKNSALVDTRLLEWPLLLRKWKTGDYFYPLGMQKKKKISRFLIDQKLSVIEKENVWVLLSNNKIIWVVGHRIDDRFKVTPTAKKLMKIEIA